MKEEKSKNKTARSRRVGLGGAAAAERVGGFAWFTGSVVLRRILAAAICFLLAFAVAGTEAFPGTYPFGIAMTAAVSGFTGTVAALCGAAVGSARIPTVGGAHALIIALLALARSGTSLWLAADGGLSNSSKSDPKEKKRPGVLWKRWRSHPREALGELAHSLGNHSGIMLRENIWVRMALSACAALFAGAWSVVEGGYAYYDLFGAVFSLFVTPIVTYLFYAAAERNMRLSPVREVSIYFLGAVLAKSAGDLGGKMLPDFGALFAILAACAIALSYGIHRGALMGLACGMAASPLLAPAYAISAVLCGVTQSISPTLAVLCGGGGAVAWAIYTSGGEGAILMIPPAILASALLIPAVRWGKVRLPEDLFGGEIPHTRHSETAEMAELSAADMKDRIAGLSDGMASVSAVLGTMAERLAKPTLQEMGQIVEEAFDLHCHGCRNREKCHEGRISRTAPMREKMTKELWRDGVVSASAVPTSIASSCYQIGRILDEINLTAGQKIARLRQGDKLSSASADYGLAGELLRQAGRAGKDTAAIDEDLSKRLRRILNANNFGASTVTAYGVRTKHIFVGDVDLTATRMGGDEIRQLFESITKTPLSQPEFGLDGAVLSMRMHSIPAYSCKAGTFSCAASGVHKYCGETRSAGADCTEGNEAEKDAEGETIRVDVTDEEPGGVCGDVITSFEADGRFYMILSDGMGSGKEAALTSGIVVTLLTRLIQAGAEMETALKMMNQIVRTAERECSATVDIAEIDLVTGEAKFIKSGAAPSFVLRNGSIFRLQSKTVPIGIMRALDAEMIRFDIEAGDTVVMVSDGAARSYDEAPWLLDLMTNDASILRGDERMGAMTIVSEAALRGASDDITAGIVRVAKR